MTTRVMYPFPLADVGSVALIYITAGSIPRYVNLGHGNRPTIWFETRLDNSLIAIWKFIVLLDSQDIPYPATYIGSYKHGQATYHVFGKKVSDTDEEAEAKHIEIIPGTPEEVPTPK